MMSGGLVSMVILLLGVRVTGGDLQVTCVNSEECVLPCSFQPGGDELIQWDKLVNIHVHSYYYSTDQLEQQDQLYRNRTSLFNNQIHRGNASLLLRNVRVQDQGKYQCYTSTVNGNQESFITVTVEAPVPSVDLRLSDDIITCSSTGIYPEPELTWSTDPPTDLSTDPGTSQNSTSTKMNDQGLYDITSTKPFIRDRTNICTVTSGTVEKTASLRQQVQSSPSSEVSIPCSVPLSELMTFDFTWRFNQKVTILTYSMDTQQIHVEDNWKEKVQSVSESGSLQLHRLTMNHQGIYSCELSPVRDTHLVLTYLEFTPDEPIIDATDAVLIGVLLVVEAGGVCVYIGLRKKYLPAEMPTTFKKRRKNNNNTNVEMPTAGVGKSETVI